MTTSGSSRKTGFYGSVPRTGSHRGPLGDLPNNHRQTSNDIAADDPLLPKVVAMLQEQKQMIDSIVNSQKELGNSVALMKSQVSKVNEEVSDLSAICNDLVSQNKISDAKKSKKLPKPLTSAVKKLHQHLENQFDPRAVSRHYESRRREYIDAQPHREAAKETNDRNTKIRSRKRQLYQRRLRQCKNSKERKIFKEINEAYMSEESDSPDCTTFLRHQPVWRSVKLNRIIETLDKRGSSINKRLKKPRILSSPLRTAMPPNAPSWAILEVGTSSIPPTTDSQESPAEIADTSGIELDPSVSQNLLNDASPWPDTPVSPESEDFHFTSSNLVDKIINEDLRVVTPTNGHKQPYNVQENVFSTPTVSSLCHVTSCSGVTPPQVEIPNPTYPTISSNSSKSRSLVTKQSKDIKHTLESITPSRKQQHPPCRVFDDESRSCSVFDFITSTSDETDSSSCDD